jgi:DNA-binding response OmpR family regulator
MSHKILVVDDEPSNRKMIGYALHSAGHSVSAAESGKEALLKIQAEIPDLVILDVMMPGMDGIEVCERLRNNPETATLPIIMLSALAQVNEKIRGLKAGADDYLTKPIDPKELVARVEALLERSRRLRQAQNVKEGWRWCYNCGG